MIKVKFKSNVIALPVIKEQAKQYMKELAPEVKSYLTNTIAVDTGKMQKSIKLKKSSYKFTLSYEAYREVGKNAPAPYSYYNEVGTIFMQARYFMANAQDEIAWISNRKGYRYVEIK